MNSEISTEDLELIKKHIFYSVMDRGAVKSVEEMKETLGKSNGATIGFMVLTVRVLRHKHKQLQEELRKRRISVNSVGEKTEAAVVFSYFHQGKTQKLEMTRQEISQGVDREIRAFLT